MNICVFGAASTEIEKKYIETVENFGELLGKKGHNLVFGAGNNGLMGACARGVSKTGKKITGVIPTFFKDEDVEQIYKECDNLIYTETMAQRKSKMEDLADAFVIVPGGIGTFEELFEVLTLKQLGRHKKPIAIYNINNYYENLERLIAHSFEERFITKDCRLIYHISDDPEDIFNYIENDNIDSLTVKDLKNG